MQPPQPDNAENKTNNVLRERFINGMRFAAATVNVITTDGPAGRAGVTVSATASVSADGDAPTMLICVHHLSAAANAIIQNGQFCANLLRDDQSHISDIFAGRIRTSDDKFSSTQWEKTENNGWRVKNSLATFDCKLVSNQRIGTHYLFIGEVQEVFLTSTGRPLIYNNRAYSSSARIWKYPSPTQRKAVYRIGGLDTFGPRLLPPLLCKLRQDAGIEEIEIYEGDQRYLLDLLRAGTIDYAFLYDLHLDDEFHTEKIYDFPLYVLLTPTHPLATKPSISLPDLQGEPFVMLDAPSIADYFLSLFEPQPLITYRAKSSEMVSNMVAHGLGCGLLAPPPHNNPSLTCRPLANSSPLGLVLCTRDKINDQWFIELCKEISDTFQPCT